MENEDNKLEAAAEKPEKKKKEKKAKEPLTKEKIIKEALSWVIILIMAFILAQIITTFLIMKAEIISGSMMNGLIKDDHMVGNRLSYVFGDPKRGDVVFFEYPKSDLSLGKAGEISTVYVKRIIGLPGEKVEIIDGEVYINDAPVPLDEPYLAEPPEKKSFGPYYVPDDCYLMLGDNRNYSLDSRYWNNGGKDKATNPDKYRFVRRDAIYARASFRYIREGSISFGSAGHYEYKYDTYSKDMVLE